ncbi:hypothetical protein LNP74_23510 [Klebsiella pneumoniae subsp. pneumoniae]|nr:hypothetical protein [Klebsiella pneumoniae subsp. pneumoniae]
MLSSEAETIDNMLLFNRRLAQPERTAAGRNIRRTKGCAGGFFFAVRRARRGLKATARLAAGGVSRGQLSLIELGS